MAKASGRNRYLRRGGGGGGLPGGLAGGGASSPFAQAQEMLARAQEELASRTVEGTAGGGAVRITMTGDQKIQGITIAPEVVDPDDVEMLQDLIMAAIADASERASEMQAESMGALTAGLKIPGLT
jgi:DNA-binding YbaB/EbfC family protein